MNAFNLSRRTKIALTGADRLRYLNGQVTNDVSKAGADTSIPACVTNAKGRLEALVQITASPDDGAFWIDADESLREELFTRLDRYIIADDCELTDITDSFQLWHVPGEVKPAVDAAACARAKRFGIPGWDLWLEADPGLEAATGAEADALRVEHLVPAWPAEATPDFFPADLGLDAEAVDFHKGCYIGQEVVSRMKMSGKSNWILAQLTFENPPESGMAVASGGKEIGKVATVSGPRALAVLRRSIAKPGVAITAGDAEKGLSNPGQITKTV